MSRRFFLAAAILWLSLCGIAYGAREEENFSIRAEVDKAFLTIGERVEYRVTVTRNPPVQILSTIEPPSSDVFEIKEAHDFSEKQGKQIVEGRRFVLTTYQLGEFILDPITVRYRISGGKEKTAQTQRIYLTVQSVDSSGKPKTDIRGPKGVVNLPPKRFWIFALFFFMGMGGAGFYFWWRWKNRPAPGTMVEETLLSAEEEALLRLSRLFDSDLLRQGKLKQYFLVLSEILRKYFERRFEIQAVELTTSEILRALRDKSVDASTRELIREVLDQADWVKFAKWSPTVPEILQINQKAKAIVEATKPQIVNPIGTPA